MGKVLHIVCRTISTHLIHKAGALPGWNDPSGLRSSGIHCAIGGPRAKTEDQSHSLPRCAGAEPPLAWGGHPGQTRQRRDANPQPQISKDATETAL
jgi:hypothetical protein